MIQDTHLTRCGWSGYSGGAQSTYGETPPPMNVRILGCFGGQMPGCHTTSFLVNRSLLVDAGTIGVVLSQQEQQEITDILLTHSHLDHLAGLPFFLFNVFARVSHTITIHASAEVLHALRTHLFNDHCWPDPTRLPVPEAPFCVYHELEAGQSYDIAGLRVKPIPVNHVVPTFGYLIGDGNTAFAFTADTGPTERFWQELAEYAPAGVAASGERLSAIITEVSFPNALQAIAETSKHMTADDLSKELRKLPVTGVPVYVFHLKPQDLEQVVQEIRAIDTSGHTVDILDQGVTYRW